MEPATEPLRVIGYIRVSTVEQATSGVGLEAQRHALTQAAKTRGWDLVDVIADEGESGGKSHEKRPGLASILAKLDAGEADVLAVAKLDRLSRSVRDLADLTERARRKHWALALLDIDVDTSTPGGEFMLNVMGSAAQWERRIISQRTKDALAVKRAQGVRLGRPSVLGHELVARIVREHSDGASKLGIAKRLTAEGVPTARGGGKWYASTVAAVLAGQDAQKLVA